VEENRGLLKERVSITERPAIVLKRDRIGVLEVDLIIGKDNKEGLLVTLDRASMLTTIDKILSKKPDHIKQLLLHRLKGTTLELSSLKADGSSLARA